MRAILPGKPQARLQAVSTAQWGVLRLVVLLNTLCVSVTITNVLCNIKVYISGNGIMILSGPRDLLQTIYLEESSALIAVTVNEATGKIATASTKEIYLYGPYGQEEGWSLQSIIRREEQELEHVTLSWGTDEELLIGSSSLHLFQTATEETEIWRRRLPKPVKIAEFSHDASLIASTGDYDRLIKLWKRQSSGADDTRFNFTYLPHPTVVTALHWRKNHTREYGSDHVLYTICGDQKIRVWAAMDPHGVQGLQLWAEIDMQASIQPRELEPQSHSRDRFAFVIDSHEFTRVTESIIQDVANGGSQQDHALEHLAEVAKNGPELCIVVDSHGHMSAWGLENVGRKARRPTDVFNVAHVENFPLAFPDSQLLADSNVQLLSFCREQAEAPLTLLAHHFDGRIEWLECKFEELLDPAPQHQRVWRKTLLTGHEGSIKKIVRSINGKAVISRTNDNEAVIWKQGYDTNVLGLSRYSLLDSPKHIFRSWLLSEGDFVVNVHDQSVSIWDARSPSARCVDISPYCLEGHFICLVQLPEQSRDSTTVHLAGITSQGKGIVWSILLPRKSHTPSGSDGSSDPSMEFFCGFDLEIDDNLAFMLPIDPAGAASWTSSSLDMFARDIAISYSSNGRLRTWTAGLDADGSMVKWLVTSTVETGIEYPSLASASSIRKAALVDRAKTGLTIWDMRNGQLEHDVQYDGLETIGDLDWSSTPDNQSLLAIGFPHRVRILAQMRYDYLSVGPAWAPIREINIKDSTPHPIGDSTWLGSGNLLIGAGNQLFVYDKTVDSSDEMISELTVPVHKQGRLNLFDLVSFLNGPLPLFHPQFLSQCILAGKLVQVQSIVVGLQKALKFFTDGDELDSFVSVSPEDFIEQSALVVGSREKKPRGDNVVEKEAETNFEEVAASLNENLIKVSIPQLTSREQIHLADMVECVATVDKHRRSMDENAVRYLLFFRQHMIRKNQGPADRAGITFREIVWAYHSGSQEILVDLISRQFQGRMLWGQAKESGMFIWMTDLTALRAQFEVIARNEYTKTNEKNPIDCSLYYLALKKKNVLIGLWRMAAWNREQASTQRLLSNNFQEARWKTAALKNAYALLGKRRFEYAAAFFLLAGNLQDAVNVCLHQMRDLQLAVAVARVYEGDDGFVLRRLLEEKVLPQAASEGNRWLATWALWMLGKRDMAVRSLISPVYTLVDAAEAPNIQARSYLANDPALVVLYEQLRGKTLKTLKGASQISPKDEWDFIIQNARLYDRMGCDLLALDLVRNWEFLLQPKGKPAQEEAPRDPRELLRRRSSLVIDDLSSPKSPTSMKAGMGKPPPQKVFEEPEANSLLDNFGF
ncbi:MAG: hypothetical protein Q9181_002191 [Wetmoreana brouardii]